MQTQLLTIDRVRDEAIGIRSYILKDPQGYELPQFTAGAHIDCHLSNGLIRRYSLCNDPRDRFHYAIAVARDDKGRGGSAFIHDNWHQGDQVIIGLPRNNFPLAADSTTNLLIGGGIGITPMMAMLGALEAKGADWRLVYASRSRAHAAFAKELSAYGDRVHLHYDDEKQAVLDLGAIIEQSAADAHLYCCGPAPMLAAFEEICRERDPDRVHVEHFTNDQPTGGKPCKVHLRKSGLTLEVGADQSILDAILAAGLDVPFSCLEGTCGECVTAVVEGIPDHRDTVLTKRRRAENKVMMVCCSRAKTDSLTLNL